MTQLTTADGGCLAHTNDVEAREQALAELTKGGDLWFVRGVTVTSDLLQVVLKAAPRDAGNKALLRFAGFGGATFQATADFGGATFQGDATFGGATFQGDADFGGVVFEQAQRLGPVAVRTSLNLSNTVFKRGAEIAVSAETISGQRLHLMTGGHLRLRAVSVDLDDAEVLGPAILAGQPKGSDLANLESAAAAKAKEPWAPRGAPPQVLSVRRANVGLLTLAAVNLGDCRFSGAHGLDKLRIEGDARFDSAPQSGRHRYRTRRRVIAEERAWRAEEGWKGWQAPAPRGEPDPPLRPPQIAALYRALRKGLEDSKDEPGAADFYYGEMEMRRHGAASRPERAVLWLYWAVSGYAMRAWRALTTLALIIAVATVTIAAAGFAPPPPPPAQIQATPGGTQEPRYVQPPTPARPSFHDELLPALTYSAESATVVFRGPEQRPVTFVGRWCQIVLRLLGPALLGLAVLSLRGRVKR